jgi:hypothetical protein
MAMLLIDIKKQEEMTKKIVNLIGTKLFHKTDSDDDIRLIRIRQNVLHATTSLLGKDIRADRVDMFCEMYASSHIQAVAKVGESVGIIAAQSINQPVTQAVLKSQHRTGNKETTGTNSLVTLNNMSVKTRIIKVHFKVAQNDLDTIAREYEEVKLEDVLSSTYGDSRYSPEVVNRQPDTDYSQNLLFVYINHMPVRNDEVVYRFRIDPSKLKDAGLTQMEVIRLLLDIKDVMVVIHPLSTFIFDIVPGDKPLTAFLEMIKTLMRKRLKGISGLQNISSREIKTDDIICQTYYDREADKTYLYLNPVMMVHFPIDELKKRVKRDGVSVSPVSENTCVSFDSSSLFHLVYDGEVIVDKKSYIYYLFTGSISMSDLLNYESDGVKFSDLCDQRYLVTNDPKEMIEFLGRSAARVIHEYNYSEELTSSKTPLLYQHITTICRRMFGLKLWPIKASSYIRSDITNAIDKLNCQYYRHNLEREIIKGKRSSTANLSSAITTGKRPELGTSVIEIVPNTEQQQRVIQLYSEARRDQKYLGKYPGITFPKIGEIEPMTRIPLKPFPGYNFPNPVKGL